jgi:hypothetical protein
MRRKSMNETTPVARTTDPLTSHLAAASVTKVRGKQIAVLDILRHSEEPLTDEEIFDRLLLRGVHMSRSGARTRRSELVKQGRVVDSGLKAKTVSNRLTIRWKAKE